jgi:hypothetical protein
LSPLEALHFIGMGLLGAVIYVLCWSKSWGELRSFESVRHLVLGPVIGYLYSVLHANYSFPDLIMAAVAGYFGVDFIQSLFERLRPRAEVGESQPGR